MPDTDNRTMIAQYAAHGNLAAARSPSIPIDDQRKSDLQAKLAALRSASGPIPNPTDDPSDFGKAIQDREDDLAAKQKDPNISKGKDVPRWQPDSRIMKPIYRAHDAIVAMPSPGGLGAILFLILLLFVILIPATSSGETRLLLLWEVLLGKKEIDQTPAPVVGADGSVTPGGPSPTPTPQPGPTPVPTPTPGPGTFAGGMPPQSIGYGVGDPDMFIPRSSQIGGDL